MEMEINSLPRWTYFMRMLDKDDITDDSLGHTGKHSSRKTHAGQNGSFYLGNSETQQIQYTN